MVVTRSQSRWALLLDQQFAEQRARQVQSLTDFPAWALASYPVVAASSVNYSGDRLVEVAPADNILRQFPAIDIHPRRWLVERCIYGGEIATSFEVGAHTSAYVIHSLELRRHKRFRSGALSSA